MPWALPPSRSLKPTKCSKRPAIGQERPEAISAFQLDEAAGITARASPRSSRRIQPRGPPTASSSTADGKAPLSLSRDRSVPLEEDCEEAGTGTNRDADGLQCQAQVSGCIPAYFFSANDASDVSEHRKYHPARPKPQRVERAEPMMHEDGIRSSRHRCIRPCAKGYLLWRKSYPLNVLNKPRILRTQSQIKLCRRRRRRCLSIAMVTISESQ